MRTASDYIGKQDGEWTKPNRGCDPGRSLARSDAAQRRSDRTCHLDQQILIQSGRVDTGSAGGLLDRIPVMQRGQQDFGLVRGNSQLPCHEVAESFIRSLPPTPFLKQLLNSFDHFSADHIGSSWLPSNTRTKERGGSV